MFNIKNHRKRNKNNSIKRMCAVLTVITCLVILLMSTSWSFAADTADLDERFTVGLNISWVYVTSGNQTASLAYMKKSDGTAIGPVYCIDKTITASTAADAYEAMLAQQNVVESYRDFKFNHHGYEATVAVEKILWVIRNGFSADGRPTAGGKTGTISDASTVSWPNDNVDDLKSRFDIETLYVPEAYQATQLALWYYSDPDETVQASLQLHKLKPNVKALYDALIAGADAAADSSSKPPLLPEISINLSFDTDENDAGYLGPVTVSIEQNPHGFVDINEIEITFEAMEGIKIIESPSGTVMDTSMKNGQSFYIDTGSIRLSEDMELLTINASVNKSSEISDAFMFSAPDMNWVKYQTLLAATRYQNSIDISDSVKIVASEFGSIPDDLASLLITYEVDGIEDISDSLDDAAVLVEGKNNQDEVIVEEEIPLDSFVDGEYLLDQIPPGSYTVTMHGEDIAGYSHTVDVFPDVVNLNPGDSSTIDIVITYVPKIAPFIDPDPPIVDPDPPIVDPDPPIVDPDPPIVDPDPPIVDPDPPTRTSSRSAPATRDNTNYNMWIALLASSTLVLAISMRAKTFFAANKRFKFKIVSN